MSHVRHGLAMAVLALICGALWAAYIATNHESLHGGFESQVQQQSQARHSMPMQDMQMDAMSMTEPAAHASADGHHGASTDSHHASPATAHSSSDAQHSHSGSLAKDAMQRLLRGHIHFMGIGVLAAVLLLIVALTSLKSCWKKVLGWTFGLGALAYPPAWIMMGFRTVELGPEGAEASVMWLFGPAVGLLLASMSALLVILLLEMLSLQHKIPLLKSCFQRD
ncbi:MAG: hypothetical protein JKY87_08415 [Mariprofundus sp.]|nr:hypothetical protein [Mariprofundus sp.]